MLFLIHYKISTINLIKVVVVNKFLFSLLVVGASFTGIQDTYAVKTGTQPLEERDLNRTPLSPRKNNKYQIPCTPMKKAVRARVQRLMEESQDQYELRGNTLWEYKPIPSYLCTSTPKRYR